MPDTSRLGALPQLPRVTALLFASGAVGLAANVVLPVDGTNPPAVLATLSTVAALVAAYALGRGRRFSTVEAQVLVVPLLAAIVLLTATTDLPVAALGNGLCLPVVGAYVVWFVPGRRTHALYVAGVVAWYAVLVLRDDGLAGLGLTVLLESIVAVEVLRRLRRRLETLTVTDSLTGALNLRGVREQAARMQGRARRLGRPLVVVVADLDDLREVNNTQGHAAGDALLRSACRHWRENLRAGDALARTGGDEFVLLLPDLEPDAAEPVVADLERTSPVSWSWGLAEVGRDGFEAALATADARMYDRKRARHAARDGVGDARSRSDSNR